MQRYKIGKKKLDEILAFTQLMNDFAYVYRDKNKNDGGKESDSEHSFQLAMVCWYINTKFELGLNDEKILKYSLVHDLTEIFEGDVATAFKMRDSKVAAKVKQAEEKAIERFKNEFKDMKFMVDYIESYENLRDEEAKFVYALDKMIPVIFVYQTEADNYFLKHKISRQEHDRMQLDRSKVNPFVYELFKELALIFEEAGIFYKS